MINNIKKTSGFTLIELLVVIAIISLLSSVVLASLNSARNKGSDANIKSNLANIRAQAELLFDTNGSYDNDTTATTRAVGTCSSTANTLFANTTVWGQVSAAMTASGGLSSCMVGTSANSWSVGIQLKQNPTTQAWCVDSSGASKQMTLDGTPIQAELDALINNGSGVAQCD